MKTYSYSDMQQDLPAIFNLAVSEDVVIQLPDGVRFKLIYQGDGAAASPLNIEGITTDITTQELIGIVKEQRR